ncbi:MAG: hypothetical protein ACRD32_03115, partial [Nitrososphaerales archaeon]
MSMYYTIKISDSVSRSYNGINLFCVMIDVTIRTNYTLDRFLQQLESRISMSKEVLKDHPVVRALRDFYWRMGIDP